MAILAESQKSKEVKVYYVIINNNISNNSKLQKIKMNMNRVNKITNPLQDILKMYGHNNLKRYNNKLRL